MRSKWSERKDRAIELRKQGKSIRNIESKLSIPKSTLSGWFKNIQLTKKQKQVLNKKWKQGLRKARSEAAKWHRAEKEKRIVQAQWEASRVLQGINLKDSNILDLALAMLYLGEGVKRSDETAMGNSDPLILKAFLSILEKNYGVSPSTVTCQLHLRADQNPYKLKKFWSETLNIPVKNFKYVHNDERTIGSKTYSDYKGVCHLRCANVAIKRKLLNISKEFCEKVSK